MLILEGVASYILVCWESPVHTLAFPLLGKVALLLEADSIASTSQMRMTHNAQGSNDVFVVCDLRHSSA